MNRRRAILRGVALVALVSFAAIATGAGRDGAQTPSRRARVHRVVEPAVATAEPTEEPRRQSGSSESEGSSSGPKPIVEHHEIHGSGRIGVVSGVVDQGEGGAEVQGSFVGRPRPNAPQR
jgi:hypothetical protein